MTAEVRVIRPHEMEILTDIAGNDTAMAAHASPRSMCNCDPTIVHMRTGDGPLATGPAVYEIWARGDCPFHGWA